MSTTTGGTMAELSTAPVRMKVKIVTGTAEIQKADGEWEALKPNDLVGVGAVVRTDAKSTVELQFEGNGSTILLKEDTVIQVNKLDIRDPATPDALDVVLKVRQGSLTGSFRSLAQASTFEIVTPGGSPIIYRPPPNQTAMGELSLVVMPLPEIPQQILLADNLFSGGASSSSLQNDLLERQALIIPEPTSGALFGLALGLWGVGCWWRARGGMRET